jgi:iron complex transport system substrate-binding protein
MGIGAYKGLVFAFLALVLAAAQAVAGPVRVVSLDYCADATLLALADEDMDLYLSPDATKPFAWGQDEAASHNRHGGSAEEILSLAPDLVIHSGLGHLKSVSMLGRFGFEIVDIGYSESLNHARQAILTAGEALDRSGAAGRILKDMNQRLQKVAAKVARLDEEGPRPQALYLTPSANTTGAGTYLDEVMALAGIDNRLAVRGVTGWASLDLEDMAQNPPDMVIASFFKSLTGWQSAWLFSRHPVTRQAMEQAMRVRVPAREWGCGGFFIIDAVETLVEARTRWQNKTGSSPVLAHRQAGSGQ